MSAIAALLIDAAVRAGTPLLKDLLVKQVGGTAGELGGAVIDAVAQQVGVPCDQLPNVPQAQIDSALQSVEADLPRMMMTALDAQREGNKLQLAEMAKDGWFGWMWRPAGMWLMLVTFAWFAIGRPIVNAALWAMMPGLQIEAGMDMATFLGVFTVFTGLYMGGNTLLRSVGKKG